jgi:hypothetical protein
MKRILIAILLLIGLMSAFAVLGHHSAAGVDRSKTVTVEGTVKQFKWGNPHAWLDVEVPNSKGGADVWSFEMTSPTFLVRAGWKATSVKAGDKVKVVGRPLKNGDPGGSLSPSLFRMERRLPSRPSLRLLRRLQHQPEIEL